MKKNGGNFVLRCFQAIICILSAMNQRDGSVYSYSVRGGGSSFVSRLDTGRRSSDIKFNDPGMRTSANLSCLKAEDLIQNTECWVQKEISSTGLSVFCT